MSFRCEICQRGPMNGVTIHRTNEKGEIGKWRCDAHPPQSGECCCNYVLGKTCSYHEYVMQGCAVIDALAGKEQGRNG